MNNMVGLIESLKFFTSMMPFKILLSITIETHNITFGYVSIDMIKFTHISDVR